MAAKRLPVTGSIGPKQHHTWRSLAGSAIPHTPPFIGWVALPIVAALARRFWATSIPDAIAATAGIVLLMVGLTAFTWHVFRARGHSVRVHAAASVAAGGVWLLIALVAGLANGVVWSIWVVLMVGMGSAWSLRKIAKGDGSDHHDADGGEGLTKAIGMAGARIGKPKVTGAKVEAPMKLVGGEHTTADAQAAKSRIESKLGLRGGAVRIIRNPDREDNPTLVIVPKDPLVKPVPWKGPNAPGESIAERIDFATYDDGTRAGLWLPGQRKPVRVGVHLKLAGMTGSGKTETGLILCTNILTRTEAGLVYIDTVKGIQSIRSIVNGVDLPVIERPKAIAVMKRLPAVIRARTQWLGEHGFSQWEPGCGLKYLVWWIEESADLIANSSTFTKDTEQARSAGITIVASQQRWTHDRVDTSARANFGAGICFGVDNEDSAAAVLMDETIDAGAEPWLWLNEKPGYMYMQAAGVSRTLWPVPARSDLAESEHLTAAVAEFAHPGLDYVTAMALGELYSDHTSLVAEGRASWQKPMVTATKMPAKAIAADEDEDLDDVDDLDIDDENEGEDELEEFVVPAQPEPGFADDIDPAQDIPDDDDNVIAIGLPTSTAVVGRTEAVDALRAELRARADAGMETIRPSELIDLRLRIGRKPAWLTTELQRLVDEGFLEEHPDRGVYGLPVPVPV